jgi:hypothetical protein
LAISIINGLPYERTADGSLVLATNDNGSGGSGGTSDATAANQQTQITTEQAIRAAIEGVLDVSDVDLQAIVAAMSDLLSAPIKNDGASFTPGTSAVSVLGAEFDDVAPIAIAEGKAGALRMSANRNLYLMLRDGAGNERGVNVTAAFAAKVDQTATAIATGQVSVGTGATLICTTRATRRCLTIINTGTQDVYVGITGVTVGTGILIVGAKGAGLVINTSAAVYGIAGSAQTVTYLEEYD